MSNIQWHHFRTLEHALSSGLTDMNYDENIPDLVEVGYLHGSWFGSLNYSPSRRWEITNEGRRALKAYKNTQLIAKTTQCPKETCKGEYGSECYLRTDCVTCGRPIIREKQNG